MTNIIEVALWTGPCAVVQIDQLIQKPLSVEKYNQKKKNSKLLFFVGIGLTCVQYSIYLKNGHNIYFKNSTCIFHPEHGI